MKIWLIIIPLVIGFTAGYHTGYRNEREKIHDICLNDHKALIIDDVWYVCRSLDQIYPSQAKE